MTATPRWLRWVTTIAVFAPLPYSLTRVAWALGIPLGIDAELLREYRSPGIGSLFMLLLAALAEATVVWTHVFLRRRPEGSKWVIAPLEVPILILAHASASTSRCCSAATSSGLGCPTGRSGSASP